ncbi:hypothetical protein TrCOL_g8140 [Triparma columacea]|uniref:MYND-type domain-containing protein n=1 Tax=Triparma columacea TaxID=722753 RepID=A0A9W7G0U8_9STRA|nr:hypothetical protein TrCOL_g8140 [Triparma columacea]
MDEKDTSLSSSPPLAAQLPPSADDGIGDNNKYDYVCYSCSKPDPSLTCVACKVARYCSKECQKRDWSCKNGGGYHKLNCPFMKSLTREGKMDEVGKRGVVDTVVRKCKLYISPFFVNNVIRASKASAASASDTPTAGYFVFLQSPDTIIMHGMPGQGRRDHLGPTLPSRSGSRQVMLKFMKYEETKELVKDDFELSSLLPSLLSSVSPGERQEKIPLLVRFRCGFVGVADAEIALGWDTCERLGWEGNDEVLFNIDDC